MKSRLIVTAGAGLLAFTSLTAQAVPVNGQGTWETTLQGRDLDGNPATFEAWYDTTLNITWLADANYALTSGYAAANATYSYLATDNINSNGTMGWDAAVTWAANLNVNGISGWRLPTLGPINGESFVEFTGFDGTTDYGYNISAPGTSYAGSTANETAHLYYNTLGNLAQYDTAGNNPQPGWGLTNTGPFSNFQSWRYWSGLERATSPGDAWYFYSTAGGQFTRTKTYALYALAVRTGDISTVPIPTAVWLFGSGLVGLIGVARRRSK